MTTFCRNASYVSFDLPKYIWDQFLEKIKKIEVEKTSKNKQKNKQNDAIRDRTKFGKFGYGT